MEQKMKIEIWSDIMCPFCYIGKKSFDEALSKVPQKHKIEVIWKSFQLQPDYQYQPDIDVLTSDSEIKGIPRELLVEHVKRIEVIASEKGIVIDVNKIKKTNTFNAHRFVKLAEKHNLSSEAETRLFKAYFTEGKLISDPDILMQLGKDIGLKVEEVSQMLYSDEFVQEVNQEIKESLEIGVTGVPFFVVDREYAFSGAQSEDSFFSIISESITKWEKLYPSSNLQIIEGANCSIDGAC
jgi:predicted DsbA family dithiol-disulfide isomerase